MAGRSPCHDVRDDALPDDLVGLSDDEIDIASRALDRIRLNLATAQG
jgi:hypothetical protein